MSRKRNFGRFVEEHDGQVENAQHYGRPAIDMVHPLAEAFNSYIQFLLEQTKYFDEIRNIPHLDFMRKFPLGHTFCAGENGFDTAGDATGAVMIMAKTKLTIDITEKMLEEHDTLKKEILTAMLLYVIRTKIALGSQNYGTVWLSCIHLEEYNKYEIECAPLVRVYNPDSKSDLFSNLLTEVKPSEEDAYSAIKRAATSIVDEIEEE